MECTSSVFRNLAALFGSKQAKRSDPPCRKRGWILRKNFIAKNCRLSTKRKLSILLNFLISFVSFICVLCKTLVLKTTTSWTRASQFSAVDGWHLQRCQIRFFPQPLNGWHDHWTFEGEWGMGYFTHLVSFSLYWKNFFPNRSGVRNFFPGV